MFDRFYFSQKVKQLQYALGLSEREARIELELLYAHATGLKKLDWLLDSKLLDEIDSIFALERLYQRRLRGEPIPYITGLAGFHSLVFQVSRDVLVPRQETETLLDVFLERGGGAGAKKLIDLGTGSGIIAISALIENQELRVFATDKSDKAIEIAKKNANFHRINMSNIEFGVGNWFKPVTGTHDFILANPPYLSVHDEHLSDPTLAFEPRMALVSDQNGLADIAHIIRESPNFLRKDGWLCVEHGNEQAESVRNLLANAGFRYIFTEDDINGQPRVSGGRMRRV